MVILHVASTYLKDDFVDLISYTDWIIASFWRVITNLAVPSFVMLSGAFIIKTGNEKFIEFYSKMFKRILLPTLIYSVIYAIMHYAEMIFAHAAGITIGADKTDIWSPIINMLYGKPHVTMWYMYMIIPLYLITPVIVMVKESLSAKWYRRLAVIMMFYGVIVEKSCSLSWILQFVSWLGYFMLGDVIREQAEEIRSDKIRCHRQMLGTGMIITAYFLLGLYWYAFTYKTRQLTVPSSFSWIVIVSTIMQFAGFSFVFIENTNVFINVISKYSLEIYLMHPIFVEMYMQLFGRIVGWFPKSGLIPAYTMITVGLCLGVNSLVKYFGPKCTSAAYQGECQ